MTFDRIKTGAPPPPQEHPVRTLAAGKYYEVLNPTTERVRGLRQRATRYGKALNRTYQVRKGVDESGTPYVRVYRVK